MIVKYGIDVVIFICSWVALFVWLSPRVIGRSDKFRKIESDIRIHKHINRNGRYDEKIKGLAREAARIYRRIAYSLSVVCAILAFTVAYIVHTLLWGAK